jgi:hypothetical protein
VWSGKTLTLKYFAYGKNFTRHYSRKAKVSEKNIKNQPYMVE